MLKPETCNFQSINDIIENYLNVEIVEVDAGSIYSFLPNVTCAVINCNYAIDFGFNLVVDYIFKDDSSILYRKFFH